MPTREGRRACMHAGPGSTLNRQPGVAMRLLEEPPCLRPLLRACNGSPSEGCHLARKGKGCIAGLSGMRAAGLIRPGELLMGEKYQDSISLHGATCDIYVGWLKSTPCASSEGCVLDAGPPKTDI